jgi:hypothetical protein
MRVGERNAAIVCPGRRRRSTDRLLIKGKRSLPLPYFRLCVGFCISAGGPKRCGTSPRRRAAKKARLPNSAKVVDMMQSSPVYLAASPRTK